MRIAICDDLQCERENIKDLLLQILKSYIVSEFDDGNKLVKEHCIKPYDLIFLDILMPAINGIDTAKKIRMSDKNTPIIFISISEEFGIESYRVLAFDYLLKPIDKKVLSETLNRFMYKKQKKHYITVNYMNVETKVLLSNIVCVESNLHKILFTLAEKNEIPVSGKLSDYENFLTKHHFIRCHKSYLVNAMHIESIINGGFLLTNQKIIKISRTFQSSAKKAYFDFVFGGDANE